MFHTNEGISILVGDNRSFTRNPSIKIIILTNQHKADELSFYTGDPYCVQFEFIICPIFYANLSCMPNQQEDH